MRPYVFALAGLAALASACTPAATAAGPGGDSRGPGWQGDTLRVPFGATAAVAGGASVRFVARGEDSRCPSNASCVWEGDAAVTVRVARAGAAAFDRTLHTSARVGADTVTAGGVRLRLFGLLPYPQGGLPRAADAEAVALFVAVRR